MERLMDQHIMAKRRIPRKIKKALRYTFLYPRVCGRYLRYGAVYTVGRNSKWTRKAAKIRRQMDYAEMINMMTKQLKGIYANSPRKSYENLDSSFFEWELLLYPRIIYIYRYVDQERNILGYMLKDV